MRTPRQEFYHVQIDFAVLVLVRELYLSEGSVAPSARARIQMPLPFLL